jgi:hypothetical protein
MARQCLRGKKFKIFMQQQLRKQNYNNRSEKKLSQKNDNNGRKRVDAL